MNKLILVVLFYVSILSCSIGQEKIELVEFRSSKCIMESNLSLIQKRIVIQEIVDDTLKIEVATWLNCGLNEIGQARINEDTLFLLSTEKPFMPSSFISKSGDTIWEEQEHVGCDCCCHFNYVIVGISKLPEFVILNNEMIELRNNKYLLPTYRDYFGNSYVISDSNGYYYSYSFYDSHKIKRMHKTKGGHWITVVYFENGSIKIERECFGDFDHIIETTYDENGNILGYINTINQEQTPNNY